MFLGGKCIVRETNEHLSLVVYSWPGRMHIYPAGPQSTIDSEGFKGGTRGAPIMPRDAVSRTANVGTL